MELLHRDGFFEIKEVTEKGAFAGYGSVYNVLDQGEDIVAPGCFTDSLAEWKSKARLPAMLWQHRSGEPIGAYTAMSEDAHGLHVEGQLNLKVQRGAECHELMASKPPGISGLSIGFLTRDDSVDRKTWIRTIKKADVWEVSPVTFPQNDQARVNQVKSIPDFESLAEFERYLRDAGHSKHSARELIAKAKDLFRCDAGTDLVTTQSLLVALERRSALLRTTTS